MSIFLFLFQYLSILCLLRFLFSFGNFVVEQNKFSTTHFLFVNKEKEKKNIRKYDEALAVVLEFTYFLFV